MAIPAPIPRPAAAQSPLAAAGLLALPVAAWCLTRGAPAWLMMWSIAASEFLALKLLTLGGLPGGVPAWRIAVYVLLWPGMNAGEFLGLVPARTRVATRPGLAKALLNTSLGVLGMAWATVHATTDPALWVGWVGMLGIIFTLHFGAFGLLSWAWRRAGFAAVPIMKNPLRSTSLGEFWGERWNLAFADLARRFVFKPLARRRRASIAGSAVFLVSGLIHESAISLPANGGWGGPTAYFMFQAVGIMAEKSAFGRRMGLGRGPRGWCWVLLIAAVPIPVLFQPVFVERVIVPMFQQLNAILP